MQRFKGMYQKYKDSPIKYSTLSLKDGEQNSRWQEQKRLFILSRAKTYLSIMIMLCLLTPLFAVYNFYLALYLEGVFGSTALCLIACIWASKYRLYATEFLLPLSVITRGCVAMVLSRYIIPKTLDETLDETYCIPSNIDLAVRNSILLLSLSDIVLFWTRFSTLLGITLPFNTFAGITVRNNLEKDMR